MGKIPSDVAAVLRAAEMQAEEIRSLHQRALTGEPVQDELAVFVKNMLENLRSALDYLGCYIRKQCCPTATPKKHFYFPLFRKRSEFIKRMDEWYPGLKNNCPALWRYLESV